MITIHPWFKHTNLKSNNHTKPNITSHSSKIFKYSYHNQALVPLTPQQHLVSYNRWFNVSHYRNQTVSLIPHGIMSKNVDASHIGHYTRNEPK